MIRILLCLVLQAGLIAQLPAAERPQAAARCAAFWQAAADVRRRYPGLGVRPDFAQSLADSFRTQAEAHSGRATVAAVIAAERAGFVLLHRAYLGGDAQSVRLHDRLAQDCDTLLR